MDLRLLALVGVACVGVSAQDAVAPQEVPGWWPAWVNGTCEFDNAPEGEAHRQSETKQECCLEHFNPTLWECLGEDATPSPVEQWYPVFESTSCAEGQPPVEYRTENVASKEECCAKWFAHVDASACFEATPAPPTPVPPPTPSPPTPEPTTSVPETESPPTPPPTPVPAGWWPNWETKECEFDNAPSWEVARQVPTKGECCKQHFDGTLYECLGVDATPSPVDQWWPVWGSMTCAVGEPPIHYRNDNVASKEECCAKWFAHIDSAVCFEATPAPPTPVPPPTPSPPTPEPTTAVPETPVPSTAVPPPTPEPVPTTPLPSTSVPETAEPFAGPGWWPNWGSYECVFDNAPSYATQVATKAECCTTNFNFKLYECLGDDATPSPVPQWFPNWDNGACETGLPPVWETTFESKAACCAQHFAYKGTACVDDE